MSIRIILALAAVALLGCSDAATRPQDPDTTQPRLIECPTDQTSTKSGLIDVFGGTVAAAGTGISLPPGAVLTETLISVTVPASTYMEVEFTANELLTFDF